MARHTPVGTLNHPMPLPTAARRLSIAEFWARLGDEDRVALTTSLSDGLVDARLTVMEIGQSGSPAASVSSVIASLDRAIQELGRARELLVKRAAEAA